MNEIITLAGIDSAQLATTDAARLKRDGLIALARGVTGVRDPDAAKSAATALCEVKAFARFVEDARAEVKAPVLELGKRIDAIARELTIDLSTEERRLSRVIGAYQAEQKRIADEARLKAMAEEQRIWEDAQAVERAKAEEAKKLADAAAAKAKAEFDELEAKAARARSESGRAKAVTAADFAKARTQMEADELARSQEEERKARLEEAGKKMVAERIEAVSVVTPKLQGISVREELVVEVVDVVALYQAAPYLVTLTPNLALIKSVIKTTGRPIAGVKHYREARAR